MSPFCFFTKAVYTAFVSFQILPLALLPGGKTCEERNLAVSSVLTHMSSKPELT